jgi:CBS-domain-containing membrane protein
MAQQPQQTLKDARGLLFEPLKDLKMGDLKQLYENAEPVILDAETDPRQAAEILLRKGIRAAPVTENKIWIGVLDLRDTVKFAVESHKEEAKKKKAKADANSPKDKLKFLSKAHGQHKTLKHFCSKSPFHTVTMADPVLKTVQLLSAGDHIVGVTNGKGELVSVCSQGQLFAAVCAKWKCNNVTVSLQDMFNAKFISGPVKSIRCDVKAAFAFEKMAEHNLSGLAVVDEDGCLIHNTSATDIKLWLQESESLDETIERFLINIRKQSLKAKFPVAFCLQVDSLGKALAKLQATGYHRLWLVDKDKRPIGVLALTDVFRFVVSQE